MPTTAAAIMAAQQRADALNTILETSKADATKLSLGVLQNLLDTFDHIPQTVEDHRKIAQKDVDHYVATRDLVAQIANLANQIDALNIQLDDIRKFCKLGTAEALAADVAAGKVMHHLTDAEILSIKEKAMERTHSAQAAREQDAIDLMIRQKHNVVHVPVNKK